MEQMSTLLKRKTKMVSACIDCTVTSLCSDQRFVHTVTALLTPEFMRAADAGGPEVVNVHKGNKDGK